MAASAAELSVVLDDFFIFSMAALTFSNLIRVWSGATYGDFRIADVFETAPVSRS